MLHNSLLVIQGHIAEELILKTMQQAWGFKYHVFSLMAIFVWYLQKHCAVFATGLKTASANLSAFLAVPGMLAGFQGHCLAIAHHLLDQGGW